MQPYPSRLATDVALDDGRTITIRPIRPGDAGIEAEFVRNLSEESRYYRFMDSLRVMSGEVLTSNHKMLEFLSRLGFHAAFDPSDAHVMRVEAKL